MKTLKHEEVDASDYQNLAQARALRGLAPGEGAGRRPTKGPLRAWTHISTPARSASPARPTDVRLQADWEIGAQP